MHHYFANIYWFFMNIKCELLKKYSIPGLEFESDNSLLIDNAEIFKNKFVNLHTHEVKKENYEIIMKNYYSNIQKIDYMKFENQFNLLINFLSKKYQLI